MTKKLFIKALLFLLIMASPVACFCQLNYTLMKDAVDLPLVNNRATIKGYAFTETLSSVRIH